MHYMIRTDVRNPSRDNKKRKQKQQKGFEDYGFEISVILIKLSN